MHWSTFTDSGLLNVFCFNYFSYPFNFYIVR